MANKKNGRAQQAGYTPQSVSDADLKLYGVIISFAVMLAGQVFLARRFEPETLWIACGCYILGLGMFGYFHRFSGPGPTGDAAPSRAAEISWFSLISLLGIFLRLWKLDRLPSGLFADEGFISHTALRILHEGWRPFYDLGILYHPNLTVYPLALWFSLFPASKMSYLVFAVLIYVAAFPFIYWTFRQWAGPRAALLTLFIFVVMRWNIVFARGGLPNGLVFPFMFGALSFLYHGLKTRKRWPFVLAAIFAGSGLYTYQLYKIFPLLLIAYGVFEWRIRPKTVRENGKNLLLFALLFSLLSVPMALYMIHQGNIGPRDLSVSIFRTVSEEHSWRPLWDNFVKTALMFGRQGDMNSRQNIPGEPMLDPAMGVLFLMGVFYALRYVRCREHLLALAGMFVMFLPGLLSTEAPHGGRTLAATPFIAFFAALPLVSIWNFADRAWKRTGRRIALAAIAVLLLGIASTNAWFYFVNMAHDVDYWTGYFPRETVIGNLIRENGNAYQYQLSSEYHQYPTILFLGYRETGNMKPVQVLESLVPSDRSADLNLMYLLTPTQPGLLHFLQKLYPAGETTTPTDILGNDLLYEFRIPAKEANRVRGLKAEGDPSLDFSGFPEKPSPADYSGKLTGSFFVPATGTYRFETKGGVASIRLSGQEALGRPVQLMRGWVRAVLTVHLKSGQQVSIRTVEKGLPSRDGEDLIFCTYDLSRGLKASYERWIGENGGHEKFVQWEPLIDYSNSNDFVFGMPYSMNVVWEGKINVARSGAYQFKILTYTERAQLFIDGRKTLEGSQEAAGSAELKSGRHSIRLVYHHLNTEWGILHFLWKTPDHDQWETVPNEVFSDSGSLP